MAAGLVQKGGALMRFALDRGEEDFLDARPAVRVHLGPPQGFGDCAVLSTSIVCFPVAFHYSETKDNITRIRGFWPHFPDLFPSRKKASTLSEVSERADAFSKAYRFSTSVSRVDGASSMRGGFTGSFFR